MACGKKCSKYTLVTFNIIFFAAGLAVMGVGIWILVDKSNFVTLTARIPDVNQDLSKYRPADTVLHQAAYLLIAAGVVTFVMAFLGCCGALKEWRPLLITYAVFLMIVLGLEIAAGVYAGVFRNTAYDYVRDTMALSLKKQYQGEGMTANGLQVTVQPNVNFWTTAWDQMMVQLECCGLNDGNDFSNPAVVEVYKPAISGAPIACCKFRNQYQLVLLDESCGSVSRIPTISFSQGTNFNEGCLPKLNQWIDVNLRVLIGVGIGIGLIQIFGIIFAFILCMAIQSDKNEVH